ncbi:glycoside hydrolase family 26 protein [Rubrolithibacter danxiaensis]|uniref:glycoside hydrolase family 26 protein n=1 Tax=Rubrolithibacter danxiaensis TaxID=3390805 RepID=UPI003BF7DC6C
MYLKTTFITISAVVLSAGTLFSCKKSEVSPQKPVQKPDTSITNPADTFPAFSTVKLWLTDKNATYETAALFYNLKKLSKTNVLFGHQDDTKRGVINAGSQWANEQHLPPVPREKSDVKEVTGAYPAVYGWDFLHIAGFENGNWFDYEKQIAHDLTVDAYNRGGVNTYCWHYANPVSQESFYWNDSPVEAVSKILPGGSHHDVYKKSLKEVAEYAKSLMGADGKLIPVIFRPFHEFDGDWFWWGKSHCTADQYKNLYQFTVTYLRDSLGVINFLYAWSPDRNFNSESEYLERYPGDEYVDLVGMDNYEDMKQSTPAIAANKLKIVSDYAKKKNKLAALTETGLQNLTRNDWYTSMLAKALQTNKIEIAYALVWANTKDAYWTPYKGHAAETDFKAFKNNAYILFGDEMPSMYTVK